MAVSCGMKVLQSSCGVAAFPSAVAILKPDGKRPGVRAYGKSAAAQTSSPGSLPLRRLRNVHHSLQLADISTTLKSVNRSNKKQRQENIVRATFDADLSEQVSGQGKDLKPVQVALAGAALVALDKGTALALTRWDALPAALRNLPSSTVCMLLVTAALIAIDRADPSMAKTTVQFFSPAVEIIQRWMPLFYTPALVMMSLIGQRIAVEEGVRLLVLVAGGWAVTLGAVAVLAGLVKKGVQTELGNAPNMSSAAPYSLWEVLTWAGVGAASGLVAHLAPNAFGLHQATVAAPFFICATVIGFLLGSQVPKPFKKILHPVITAAVVVNVITFLAGAFTNRSFETMLGLYMTKSMQTPGGGDILMALLGPLTLTYAFTLFRQRSMLRHHATEFGAVVPVAAIFSILFTIVAGRQLGLHEFLTRSVAARSTTLAFAIPVTNIIGGSVSNSLKPCHAFNLCVISNQGFALRFSGNSWGMDVGLCRGRVDSCNCGRRYRASGSELNLVGTLNAEGSSWHCPCPCNGMQFTRVRISSGGIRRCRSYAILPGDLHPDGNSFFAGRQHSSNSFITTSAVDVKLSRIFGCAFRRVSRNLKRDKMMQAQRQAVTIGGSPGNDNFECNVTVENLFSRVVT